MGMGWDGREEHTNTFMIGFEIVEIIAVEVTRGVGVLVVVVMVVMMVVVVMAVGGGVPTPGCWRVTIVFKRVVRGVGHGVIE